MKLTVLTDNHTHIDQYYLGEPALCLHIETDGRKILLDTGYSDVCLRNSRAMGIDLRQVDTIVLSHGHNDHTRGLLLPPGRWPLGGQDGADPPPLLPAQTGGRPGHWLSVQCKGTVTILQLTPIHRTGGTDAPPDLSGRDTHHASL